jgi:hypothetical protein
MPYQTHEKGKMLASEPFAPLPKKKTREAISLASPESF